MKKRIIETVNGCAIIEVKDGHGSPKYQVAREASYLGRNGMNGYASLDGARKVAKRN